ncbi:MAG: type I methionyl aminopeptidase [candidate division KSB1 bacterium]|nr:type I methionyl aminopeptidase [candidate division KSB1 bacterium]MDZ7301356.1 type I methionyl aminopeptidase [candidate division KSB1 bacterium]MDZ7310759.1 type I methionyl aminopeptidase [candidate division KSB1 bacterium]
MIHIKSEREIGLIRQSCQLVVETFKLVDRIICEGMTTGELDYEIEKYVRQLGGRPAFKGYKVGGKAFPASSCISVESEVVHGVPGERKLKAGEIVSVDIGIEYNGFYGDAAKTYAIGEVDELRQRLMKVTWEALYRGIEQARAGKRLQDVSYAIQTHVESAGFSIVRELVGHGVGRRLHEDPQIPNYGKPNHGPRLRPGMVLAIEPMVNAGRHEVITTADDWTVVTADKQPSAHFEHSVVIREGEAEILTQGL